LQEIRIQYRRQAIEADNHATDEARIKKKAYIPEILSNGETLKQLLAGSRYLMYKSEHNWTLEQKTRAEILFSRYPDLRKAYDLSQKLSWIYSNIKDKVYALTWLAKWHEEVVQAGFKTFNTISRTIELNYRRILNYFNNRSTNASAESFNAKIKAFRVQYRGVTDVNFFLFRIAKLFA
jgi:transposase